ncbi:MAG: hypothetical protein IJ662_02845 [Clostridia bacterium]|nr:hypothetical protein [Clostridia bacterium]
MKRLICLLALLTLLPVAAWGEGLPRLADIPTLNAQGCPPPKRLTTPEEAAAQALAYAQSPLLNWRVPEDAALNARQDMDYDLDHVTVYITNFSDPLGLADETEALRGVDRTGYLLLREDGTLRYMRAVEGGLWSDADRIPIPNPMEDDLYYAWLMQLWDYLQAWIPLAENGAVMNLLQEEDAFERDGCVYLNYWLELEGEPVDGRNLTVQAWPTFRILEYGAGVG